MNQQNRRLRSVVTACAAAFAGVAAMAGVAKADLIFDRPPGTFDGGQNGYGNGDDNVNTAPLPSGKTFDFYPEANGAGTGYNQVRISSNGVFELGSTSLGGGDYGGSGWQNRTRRQISPFWADLNTKVNNFSAGGVFAGTSQIGTTTYSNAFTLSAPACLAYGPVNGFNAEFGFQVALFLGNQSVTLPQSRGGGSFNFQQGDIAFSYVFYIANRSLGAAIGVSKGDGTFKAVPGVTSSPFLLTSLAQLQSTILGNDPNAFVLFRWNAGTGNYDASIETFAIPEPASAGVLGLAALGLGRRRRRVSRA
jgi:hypothetical protein